MGGITIKILSEEMTGHFTLLQSLPQAEPAVAYDLLAHAVWTLLKVIGPLCVVAVVVGVGVNYAQVGSLFTFEPLQPKFDRLDPIKGFKNKFFSGKAYIELGKSLVKFVVIALILYSGIKGELSEMTRTMSQPLDESLALAARMAGGLAYKVGFVLLAIGGLDVFLQRQQFMKQMKMSKDEVKREYKESEGSPEMKGQRKALHREMSSHDVRRAVQKAQVVIVNPTHLAIAVEYERGAMGAPQITAKGQDEQAQRIRELAKEFGVPITRNVPLAHALNEFELGREVPPELFTAVAEVLNWVYEQKGGPKA